MTTLQNHIEHLEDWLKENNPNSIWDGILIGDESDIYCEGKISSDLDNKLLTPSQYESKFISLLNGGYSWLNLSAVGISEGKLIICVEKPAHSSGLKSEQVSINFSGGVQTI